MDEVGISEHVPEEAGTGTITGPAARLSGYVKVLNFQQVARLGALDVDRTGEGVSDLGIEAGEVGAGHARLDLGVGGVAGFEDDFLAGVDFDDWQDVRVPAVVAELGFLLEAFRAVDGDGLHCVPSDVCQLGSDIMTGGSICRQLGLSEAFLPATVPSQANPPSGG